MKDTERRIVEKRKKQEVK